jgi:Fic family protein
MVNLTSVEVERFRRSPNGHVERIRGHDARFAEDYDHWAFMPDPLPETVELSQSTWRIVAQAMLSLGRLDQAGIQVPDPALLRRPTLRREAQATSALEGTYAPLSEVLEADPDDADRPARSPELREVLNYVRAAEYGYAAVVDRRVTLGLLLDLHRLLVTDTPADGSMAGCIRDHQVVIGRRGCRVPEARFVPPPPGPGLDVAVRQWIDWTAKRQDVPPLVRAALGHYQFETLHPFNDGNGRIGRLLIVLQLLQDGVLREPLLTVSPWFEARRRDYQDQLERVSASGDWDPWVAFFADGIGAQAEATARMVGELLAFQEDARAQAHSAGVRGVALEIIDGLIARPVLTAAWVAAQHGVSRQTATAAVARLAAVGVLTETTGRAYGRVYSCDEVVRIIER